jgi:hypothetical protein
LKTVLHLCFSHNRLHKNEFLPPLSFTYLLHFLGGWSFYIAQSDLKLMVFLLQSPNCWDYRCAPGSFSYHYLWAIAMFTILRVDISRYHIHGFNQLWNKTVFFKSCACEILFSHKKNEILLCAGKWNWRTLSSAKLARFRKSKAACFLSHVEYRLNTNTNYMIYTYKHIKNMHPKVELVKETKGGRKGR